MKLSEWGRKSKNLEEIPFPGETLDSYNDLTVKIVKLGTLPEEAGLPPRKMLKKLPIHEFNNLINRNNE